VAHAVNQRSRANVTAMEGVARMKTRWGMVAALCLLAMPAQAQEIPAWLEADLRGRAGLDSARIDAVRRGEAVATELDTGLPREIAVFGIAAVRLSRDAYVRRVLDFGPSTRPPTRRRFGIFSLPPAPADVRDVVVAERDVKDLRDCRPGACVMKLPATAIARLADMDWRAADVPARVTALARQDLISYVADYLARGDTALVVYDDHGSVRASEVFAELLAATPQVEEYAPALHRHLLGYPAATLPGASEVLFWSEDELPPLRPVLSVTHLVIFRPPARPDLTLAAAKQLYANHYFEAAFDLTCYVEGPARAAGQGGHLVALRRYRFDRLPSGGPHSLRARAVDAARRQLLADLRRFQNR